jgi:hypothetical protein
LPDSAKALGAKQAVEAGEKGVEFIQFICKVMSDE